MLDIPDKVRKLVRWCGTSDPYQIARECGARIEFADLGNLKGLYAIIKRNRFIVIGSRLNGYTQKLVCAHELGHDQLHRELAKNRQFQELALYDMSLRPEYEANMFAAELLLSDSDTLELIARGYDNIQIAKATYTDSNLVGIKVSALQKRGFDLRPPGYRSDFLK